MTLRPIRVMGAAVVVIIFVEEVAIAIIAIYIGMASHVNINIFLVS